MARKRKSHSAQFKAQVALAALRGDKTVNEIASQFEVHPTLVNEWKKRLSQQAESVFASPGKPVSTSDAEALNAQLFEQIGRLEMDLEWLKKKLPDVG
jgi:transposase-like protein